MSYHPIILSHLAYYVNEEAPHVDNPDDLETVQISIDSRLNSRNPGLRIIITEQTLGEMLIDLLSKRQIQYANPRLRGTIPRNYRQVKVSDFVDE